MAPESRPIHSLLWMVRAQLMPPTFTKCPSAAVINAYLGYLEVSYALATDSDARARLIDQFNLKVPTPCMTTTQATRLLALTSTLQGQAKTEAASFDIFGSGLYGFITRIAIGILGVVLIVVGFIMIGGEATLNQAASKLGKSIGQGVRGVRK